MMTSINRTYTPSFETTKLSNEKYTTPKNEKESNVQVKADKRLIVLLNNQTNFEALAGKDGILTVKEANDLLENNGEAIKAKLKELRVLTN